MTDTCDLPARCGISCRYRLTAGHDLVPCLCAGCHCQLAHHFLDSIKMRPQTHKRSNCRFSHDARPPPNAPSEFDRFVFWLDIEWVYSFDNNGSTARPRTCPSPDIFSDVSANRCFQTNPFFDCVTCVISFNLSLSLAIYLIDRDFEVN